MTVAYTWIEFNTDLSERLRLFRDKRPELIEKLQLAYQEAGLALPRLEADGQFHDVDPFTVFALFNRSMRDENRIKVAAAFARAFAVKAPVPTDFNGIPVYDNRNNTFYAFSNDHRRGDKDIDNLWELFCVAQDYADQPTPETRKRFAATYDVVKGQYFIRWKITVGLFLLRPACFLGLDSRNRWYLKEWETLGAEIAQVIPENPPTGEEYLQLCDAVNSELATGKYEFSNFAELSHAAFVESERVNKERKAARQAQEQESGLGDADVVTTRYWLYAPGRNAVCWQDCVATGTMQLGWHEVGNLNGFQSKEELQQELRSAITTDTSQSNSALALWQFLHEITPGDVIYVKRGQREILGKGIVTGDYEYLDAEQEYPHRRAVNWIEQGVWEVDRNFAPKTLTEITDYPQQQALIEECFGAEETESIVPVNPYPEYTADDFCAEVFLAPARYQTLVDLLKYKKNIILQGAPGVGKTYAAKRLAYSLMGLKDISRVQIVQFHQSYAYEDFIEGYRPSSNGFELAKGSFYEFCKRAGDDEEHDYFFIIDEINRGNLSKIFGELFMLLEADKRGPKNKLNLLYSREQFYVPANVYVIGMMNTADRSLALLDYALRRRFAFFDLEPGFATAGFQSYAAALENLQFNQLIQAVVQLNEQIALDPTLGAGFRIGHSYFCGLNVASCTSDRLQAIVNFELLPLLQEYWFDEPEKVQQWLDKLQRALA